MPFHFCCLTDSQNLEFLNITLLMANKLIVCSLAPLRFGNFQSLKGDQVCSGLYDHRVFTAE